MLWMLFCLGPCVPAISQTVPPSSSNGAQPVNASSNDGSCPSQPPHYELLREEEDWSYLRNALCRSDYFDPAKYLSLGRPGWFITLGGEVREWFEQFQNDNWGQIPGTNGYLLQRYMLSADVHWGKHVRTFVQLKSGLANGRRGGPRPIDEDRFDFNQFFVEAQIKPTESPEKPVLALRVGRQELDYGSGRLVSAREGPNVRQSFDGLRAILRQDHWRVDAFAMRPDETNPGYVDDVPDHTQTFWGVYATRPVPRTTHLNIDLYYLGLDRKQAQFEGGSGRHQSHTVGTRFWSNRGTAFDYDVELAYQWGRFRPGPIRAWTLSTTTGYTFQDTALHPRLGVATGFASGDHNPQDAVLNTFYPLFPRGLYFGYIGENGPLNVSGFRPDVTLNFPKRVTFQAESFFFWRQSIQDGLYNVPGFLVRTSQFSRARYIGTQPQIELSWQVDRHLLLDAAYSRFQVGPFLRQTPPGRNIGYFVLWASYKF